MKKYTLILSALLSACSTPRVAVTSHETIVKVPVPVIQPCVAGERPAKVTPLNVILPQKAWDTLDIKQKSALVGRQGLDYKTYGEQIDAVTGACE